MSKDNCRNLALSQHLFGEYLPHMAGTRAKDDYWLLDDQALPGGDVERQTSGLFLRSPSEEDLIDMRSEATEISEQMQRMTLDGRTATEGRTLFLAPMPSPLAHDTEQSQTMAVMTVEENVGEEGEGLFIRSELDDWVVA